MNDNLGTHDYGVCRGVDPSCFRGWPRPAAEEYRLLLYTRTAGPRHAALGAALPPGLNPPLNADNVVHAEMLRLAQENGWKLDYTEDLQQMRNLKGYHGVIFISTSRDNLDDDAKTALRQYMRAGGSFVGVHNSFGTLYNWPWYEGLLGGANLYDHGPVREGEVVRVGGPDASTSALPARWRFQDEWYNLVPFPTKVRFLATVDEESWGPPVQQARPAVPRPATGTPARLPTAVGQHPGHGSFHPVAWCQYYDGGKAWLTTLGHDARAFQKDSDFPGAEQFQQLLVGGIASAIGQKPFCVN